MADVDLAQPEVLGNPLSPRACVYVISAGTEAVKVGLARDPMGRLRALQTGHYHRLTLSHVIECDEREAAAIERAAHAVLKHKRLAGEWFAVKAEEAQAAIEQAVAYICARKSQAIREGGIIQCSIEKITRKGKEFAVIPLDDLQKLMEDAEMLADVKAYDAAKGRLERGEDELIPLEITERRLAGESTVKVWRQYRGLTQEELAKASKVSRPMIAAIEAGHKKGGIGTLKKLAGALNVDLDNLA